MEGAQQKKLGYISIVIGGNHIFRQLCKLTDCAIAVVGQEIQNILLPVVYIGHWLATCLNKSNRRFTFKKLS